MKLHVIGTGSAGNCYLLQQGDDSLLLDAGLRWQKILPNLQHGIRGIHACLITHEHKDHCKALATVKKHGIPTVMSAGTWFQISRESGELDTTSVELIRAGQTLYYRPFTVMAIKALHDAVEPLGYLIRHEGTMETVLYATDTYALPNKYPDINHWIVECNFLQENAEKLLETPEKAPLYDRLMKSHMSLERLLEALKANDLTHTRTIVLIHISDERGDSKAMENAVRDATGIRTVAAANGMEIDLGSCPF